MKHNKIKVLSDREVQEITEATVRILEETGVKIDSQSSLEKLKAAGLPVDMSSGVATFPEPLLQKCLDQVPKSIDVYDRNGERAFTIGDDNAYFASGHNAVFFDDPITGEHRQFTVREVEEYVRLSHHLEDIDMIGLPASPADVNSRSSLLYSLDAAIRLSTKPIYFSTDSEIINHFGMEMTLTAAPEASRKGAYMISQLSPTSPLFWEKGAVEGVVECAERGFPVAILPEPIAGVSSPYSLAGLVTVHNAEALSGICITQLPNPGTPVIWASSWTTFDMKKSTAFVGSIETTLARIAGAQVAKYYNLPLHTTAPNSDNHAHDEQNSWEKTFSTYCAAAAGNDLIVNLGMYACGMTISHEQLVLDAEIVGQVRRLLAGVDASTEMIGEDLIKQTGHRGTFIMADHTLNLLYGGEHRDPLIAERGNREIWAEVGKKDTVALARDKVRDLLTRDVPEADREIVERVRAQITRCELELQE